ncbi:HK97 family phage prohead protease [Saccharothrix sp. NRRL B-16314]|uniref:HK97 family phage prohead protease n=1 Tax=Saccharothrix sp. NRRL B-16314 TaxID=1463825 RepID=UPI0012DC647E|nr:HK97 family phage prohead protease [Saccharothrix sp. NRRL B-16314]
MTTTEPATGVVEVLAAVTGVKDDVGDVITPGAFARTLRERRPKVCLSHDWSRPIGRVLEVRELLPGDARLPGTTTDGSPWPKGAGALWARALINTETPDGRAALLNAKFFGPQESTWSIGYNAKRTRQVGGTRHIDDLDLFEFGPVLHPANRHARLIAVKGIPFVSESKVVALRAGGPSSRPGRARLSRVDLAAVRELRQDVGKLYEAALDADAVHVMTPDGDVVPAACAVCRGRVLARDGGRAGGSLYCGRHAWGRAA